MKSEAERDADETFIVRFSSWEGPIEAMLDLARSQKIDLVQIDILDLVEQFERVVGRAMSLRLELAADWLVMAAWLAYLKSRILLRRPRDGKKEEADEDILAFHLKRLDAVKKAAEALPSRIVLGRDWFAPGGGGRAAEPGNRLAVSFADLLAAYPRPREASALPAPETLKPFDLSSVDAAIARLGASMPEGWTPLLDLVPKGTGLRLRSNIATSLIGSLELARSGEAAIRQDAQDGPIYVRRTVQDAA